MSKYFKELSGFKPGTIAKEIGIHPANVYVLLKKKDPRIKDAIKNLKKRKVKPDMVKTGHGFYGLDPDLIAKESGYCKSTIYNFRAGKASNRAISIIMSTIEKLKTKKDENHGLQQEPELEGSISDRS